MDCTEMIKEIAKEITTQMNKKNMKMQEIDWILAQVKENIYASTPIQIID